MASDFMDHIKSHGVPDAGCGMRDAEGARISEDGVAAFLNSTSRMLVSSGAGRILEVLSKSQLTVICYHRVFRADDRRFQGYKPNLSASQEAFTQQMDFLRTYYSPISLCDLVDWLYEGRSLPPRPVLVTFDDGFRDNAETAWPILRERDISPVIFLSTDCIDTGKPFIWDAAAYLFAATTREQVELQSAGTVGLKSESQRDAATAAWANSIRRLQGHERWEALIDLSTVLGVPLPQPSIFRHLYLDWSDVRELAQEGVHFGAHTQTHPILTSLSSDEAAAEIVGSIERVAQALGAPPLGFAYPNGSERDYSSVHEKIVEACGVPVAFSLVPGPMSLSQVRDERMAIRRIYVGAQDTMPRFIAKLAGSACLFRAVHR